MLRGRGGQQIFVPVEGGLSMFGVQQVKPLRGFSFFACKKVAVRVSILRNLERVGIRDISTVLWSGKSNSPRGFHP